MKKLMMMLLLTTPATAAEYMVLHLPFAVKDASSVPRQFGDVLIETEFREGPHGSSVDMNKTTILNELAADGWRVVSVNGNPGVHVVYLVRE